ncbi:hypothetical protein H6P81_012464 [Aristolochia fimbriata]|uniref:Helicase C-terminal domain-containing protein n=1 Tax=Aristolochia fimbriata TaxID=158543 RepID=A0AAV7EEN8_ARIFI|nr:hypothetical protein H6P81_012464 [Aristolochia fimbriata]
MKLSVIQLSIKAAGVGLTLTAASTVILSELSWNPGDITQAEDRAHRIGRASSVNVYYLLANDTVDDILWDVVQNKTGNLGQMLDGYKNTLEVSSAQRGKEETLDCSAQMSSSSPKQGTLDSFLKRCHTSIDRETANTIYEKTEKPKNLNQLCIKIDKCYSVSYLFVGPRGDGLSCTF